MKVTTHDGNPTWRLFAFVVALMSVALIALAVSASSTRSATDSLENVIEDPENGLSAKLTEIDNAQGLLRDAFQDIIDNQEASRERGFINRSVSCQAVVVDNDRTWEIPDECLEDDVIKYYPPSLCAVLSLGPPCGSGVIA